MPDMFGRYELGELLGRGGMGEVFRARDTLREREVALKVLPQHLAQDANFTARFRRESRLAAQLNDPHIIPIHDFGEIDGRLFIDMRLVEGRDLSAVIDARGPFTPPVAIEIVAQVASALDAAHERDLVHRDVKPSNVLLSGLRDDPNRVPFAYLVDFGIARSTAAQMTALTTTSTSTVGTVAYMPPERISGEPGDKRADIYALACVLYEALTGTTPYGGEPFAVMYAHVNSPPPPPSERMPHLPRELDAVIARGMAKDPADRYPTAGEFAAAAQAVVRDTTSTGPVPVSGPVAYPVRDPSGPTSVRNTSGPTADPSGPTRIFARPLGAPGTDPSGTDPFVGPPLRRPAKRRRAWIAAAAVVLLAGGGTGVVLATRDSGPAAAPKKKDVSKTTGPAGPLGATPRTAITPGGSMTWAISAPIANYNPYQKEGDTSETRDVVDALLPAPFHFDAAGTPSVDTDYFRSITKTSDRPLTIDYKINPKAAWSDGTPITWADFASQRAALSGIGGFEISDAPGYGSMTVTQGSDARDVVVSFATPYSDWQALFSPLLPKSLTATSAAFNSSWAAAPAVTAGPFRWVSADSNRTHIKIARDDSWWGPDPAELDSITFVRFDTPDAAITALRKREVDYAFLGGTKIQKNVALVRRSGRVAVRTGPGRTVRYVLLNTRVPPLDDPIVRRAVFLAIDRKQIGTVAVGPNPTIVQNHFFTPGVTAYTPTCGELCSFDVAKAKALLESDGWKLGGAGVYVKNGKDLSLEMTIPTGVSASAEFRAAQASLATAGIALAPDEVSGTLFPTALAQGGFQTILFNYAPGRFPVSALGPDFRFADSPNGLNPGAGGSREIDADLVRAATSAAPAQRDQALTAASTAMWDNAAWLPVYLRPQPTGVNPTLVNIGSFGLSDVRYADIGFHT